MRNTFLLTVALLFVLTCSDDIGIGVVGTVSSSAFQCLKTALAPDTLRVVFVRLFRSANVAFRIDPNGARTIVNAVKQGITTIPYV
jgi:hypothetical protein